MKIRAVIAFLIQASAMTSVASAETLYTAGDSGVVEPAAAFYCGVPILAEAKMIVDGQCAIAYPINLAAGKTIDNVIVAYSSRPPTPDSSIAAYLAENRVNTGMGVIVVAGTNLKQISQSGPGSISMGSISVPIVAGNVNWVQVASDSVDVQYVAITYH